MRELFETASTYSSEGKPYVIVTLTGIRGEAPGVLGNKILVGSEGLQTGTIGGGKVEAHAIKSAQELLLGDGFQLKFVTWNLQKDIGMTCGGEVTFLFEVFHTKPWNIAIFGAGHVAQCLVRTLLPLNCKIHCMDPRTEWLDRLPKANKLSVSDEQSVDHYLATANRDTFFAVLTQGHATDVPILEMIFRRFTTPKFVGVIGSEIKASRIKADLIDRGITMQSLEHLRCPIGLRIGTNAPEEIAISIVAEMLQVRK